MCETMGMTVIFFFSGSVVVCGREKARQGRRGRLSK